MVSDETAHLIDEEIRKIIDKNYGRAQEILKTNMDKLHLMAEALVKYETIESEQIDEIMAGKKPHPPRGWTDDDRRAPPTETKQDSEKDKTPKGVIGGPASQH
jgi:cell division protease FtsH